MGCVHSSQASTEAVEVTTPTKKHTCSLKSIRKRVYKSLKSLVCPVFRLKKKKSSCENNMEKVEGPPVEKEERSLVENVLTESSIQVSVLEREDTEQLDLVTEAEVSSTAVDTVNAPEEGEKEKEEVAHNLSTESSSTASEGGYHTDEESTASSDSSYFPGVSSSYESDDSSDTSEKSYYLTQDISYLIQKHSRLLNEVSHLVQMSIRMKKDISHLYELRNLNSSSMADAESMSSTSERISTPTVQMVDNLEDHCDATSAKDSSELEKKESQAAVTVEEGNSKKNEAATLDIDSNNVQEKAVIAKTDSQDDTREGLEADLPEQKCIVEENSQTSPIEQSPDDHTANLPEPVYTEEDNTLASPIQLSTDDLKAAEVSDQKVSSNITKTVQYRSCYQKLNVIGQ